MIGTGSCPSSWISRDARLVGGFTPGAAFSFLRPSGEAAWPNTMPRISFSFCLRAFFSAFSAALRSRSLRLISDDTRDCPVLDSPRCSGGRPLMVSRNS